MDMLVEEEARTCVMFPEQTQLLLDYFFVRFDWHSKIPIHYVNTNRHITILMTNQLMLFLTQVDRDEVVHRRHVAFDFFRHISRQSMSKRTCCHRKSNRAQPTTRETKKDCTFVYSDKLSGQRVADGLWSQTLLMQGRM